MDVLTGLLHDAPAADGAPDLAAHRALRRHPFGWAVGPLVVADERLARLGGIGADGGRAEEDPEVAVSVRSSTGAGGLLNLANRRTGVHVAAVETVLRDLDDLPGNAARVVAAAASLASGVDVYVEVPGSSGLVEAVETVEAAGLLGRVDLFATTRGSQDATAAERLSVLVEADLAFKVCGLSAEPFGPYGVAAVLMTVEALVDGAEADEAAALLSAGDQERMLSGLRRWDAATQSRVQRRLRGVDCPDVRGTLDALADAGLLATDA